MAVEAQRLPLEQLAAAAARVAAASGLRDALVALADTALGTTGADLVVLRVADADGELVARQVAPSGSPLAAEVAGSRGTEASERAAERARAAGLLVVPALVVGRTVGSVELIRLGEDFAAEDRPLADLLATQLALAVRALAPEASTVGAARRARWLELAGDALAAGGDAARAAGEAVRIAVDATAARGGALWRIGGERPELLASAGPVEAGLDRASDLVAAAVETWRPTVIERQEGLPAAATHAATLTLGQPPFAALQLFYGTETAPVEAELPTLAGFAARAAHALRAGERAKDVEAELERTRALLEVVGEAISRLSLAHTLETAVERVAELLQVEQIGVYLREGERLLAAAGRGLSVGHEDVAARMLEALHGPLRARAAIHVDVADSEPALAAVRASLRATGRRCAVGVPLDVHEETIGLLVAYTEPGRLEESDLTLLTSLAAQLAVAVQNAQLHEQTRDLGDTLGAVLESERQTSRQVNALYEISRSFAQSLSLDRTLDAVTATIVEVLEVDAAVLRVPDERGDQFVPWSVRVAETRLADPVSAILHRPQPRPARATQPTMLDVAAARRLGGAHALLVPFLEKGSTAALLPVSSPTELLAQLTILSLDPEKPIAHETLATAATIAQQAALAIDNARLYQQQKAFAETMQRSLLPREQPDVPGIDVGTVYESAAQVDVGGDVFDFLELPDDRLAVVLGDVTGHGIDATADMAMAKFVFRSLAREHSDPGAFLERANDVVVSEIAVGKFITMAYVTIDRVGEVLCASAGHPEPRVVHPDGSVTALECGGLALGIIAPQAYDQVRTTLPLGGAVVLYTDGVIESRAGRELFGIARLDDVLAEHADRPAQELADAVLAACRSFAGGDLPDDCAIVVIKRTSSAGNGYPRT